MTERQSLAVVGVAHLVVLALLSLALTTVAPPVPPEDAIPVEFVEIAAATRAVAPAVAPEPPPPPAAAEPTPAPAPPPKPEPEPEPMPKPEPDPVPARSAEKPEPTRPEPKAAKPEPEKVKPAPERLDTAALSSLLDKALPKAKPQPKLDAAALAKSLDKALPKTPAAAKTARLDPRATASLIAAIRAQVAPCWNPPIGGTGKMTVLLHLDIARNGGIVGRPGVVSATGVTAVNGDYARTFAETARRAVLRCAPLKLPPELYDQWKAVEINFDPNDLG